MRHNYGIYRYRMNSREFYSRRMQSRIVRFIETLFRSTTDYRIAHARTSDTPRYDH